MDVELVEQACPQRLLNDARPAADVHVPLAGCCARLLERSGETVGDEEKGRAAGQLEWFPRMVREHEDGRVERRGAAPPAVGIGVALPRAFAAAEHPAPHHDRAARLLPFRESVALRAGVAAFQAVFWGDGPHAEYALMHT